MFDKNNLRYIDYTLLFFVTCLVCIGVVMVGSANEWVLDKENFQLDSMMLKQILGFGIGLVAMLLILLVNYDVLKMLTVPLYIGVLFLLILVLFIGVGSEAEGDDVRRWIRLFGGFTLQPSEFAKISIILIMAWYLNIYQEKINNIIILLLIGIVVVIPLYLVYEEPDLSTTIVILSIICFMLFNANLGWRYVLPAIILGSILVVVVYQDAISGDPKILGIYQAQRILAWKYPEQYVLDDAYQTIQSTNAIGSGGLLGVGLFQSSGTVPVATTDFIFGIIGEELGFVGAITVIILLLSVFVRILSISRKAHDTFGRLVCIGVAISIIMQSAIHIGVCTGVLPNTGIPLPFVSYGLSSLTSSMIGIGLVLKVASESKQNPLKE